MAGNRDGEANQAARRVAQLESENETLKARLSQMTQAADPAMTNLKAQLDQMRSERDAAKRQAGEAAQRAAEASRSGGGGGGAHRRSSEDDDFGRRSSRASTDDERQLRVELASVQRELARAKDRLERGAGGGRVSACPRFAFLPAQRVIEFWPSCTCACTEHVHTSCAHIFFTRSHTHAHTQASGEGGATNAEVLRLRDENAKLKKELSHFDLDFFEEIEDLKVRILAFVAPPSTSPSTDACVCVCVCAYAHPGFNTRMHAPHTHARAHPQQYKYAEALRKLQQYER